MARYFLVRPVFAIVISLFLLLAGFIALLNLPVAEYPQVAPPTVEVGAVYPGANAEVVTDAVVSLVDSQINGVSDMRYIKSIANNDGTARVTVTFELDRDVDIAAVETQNRVSQVESRLPNEVNDIGITVAKASPDILMFVSLFSPDDSLDSLFIDNYLFNYLVDPLKRVSGVGDLQVFGSEFGMRVWLDPHKMAQLGLTASDIVAAISEQNQQAVAGKVGQLPADSSSGFEYTLKLQGRLVTAEEFANVVLRAEPNGTLTRLKDVARVELGAKRYNVSSQYNGHPSSAFAIYLSPGANALETAESIRSELSRLSAEFPMGLEHSVVYDTSKFVDQSIREVIQTFVEALLLVLIVVFAFLQSWRATIIPMIAVPVSLVATFIAYEFLGFSINTLSLFGMILAIGIVVDDAIVVVEAVEHKIEEKGLSPLVATQEAMDEVSGPILAISLVLAAVFIPMAFVPGVVGQLYQQFALTIAISTAFSALVALTLTPVLCASLLKPRNQDQIKEGILGRFFVGFNSGFARMTDRYIQITGMGVRGLRRMLFFFSLFLGAIYALTSFTPTGFVPSEDKGAFFVQALLTEAASSKRTSKVVDELAAKMGQLPGVKGTLGITGYDLITGVTASNGGLIVVELEDWSERQTVEESLDALMAQAYGIGYVTEEALVFPFNAPPLPGYGAVSGFSMMLQAKAGQNPSELAAMTREFVAAANNRPEIGSIRTTFSDATPNYELQLDRDRIKSLGVPTSEVFRTLQVYLASLEVNDFNLFGKNYRVVLQAEEQYRRDVKTLSSLFVRAATGEMIPLDTVVSIKPSTAPRFVMRYNLFPAAELSGEAAPGYSSGEALQALEETAQLVLTPGYGFEWSGQTLEEVETGNVALIVLALSLLVVFLFLAALYESWSVPFAVLLAVPFGVLGAFFGLFLSGAEYNVYGQIGLVTLVGLGAKNAVLIVEYAKLNYEKGMDLVDAALEAARLRLRPIIMTSFAFILGVVPLMLADGAGSAAKQSLGTVVFSGMLGATILGVVFIPAFYVLVQRLAVKSVNQ